MSRNRSLHDAKKAKNDEFYTQISDIEKELGHYKKHFKDKIVFCNCDDPEQSEFWRYFALNFDYLQLKKLVATHFDPNKPTYKLELFRVEDGGDQNGDGRIDELDTIRTLLQQNGDFRSPECIEILKECDIVVTNPPFSYFREYIAQLVEYKKKFLVIGNINAITCKEIFSLIKDGKVWIGYTSPKKFIQPNGTEQKIGNITWYTNLPIKKRVEPLILYKTYNEKDYPKYDNYDVINVDKVKDIPTDYYEVMGVPITFLNNYCPEQFEIVGATNNKHIYGISFTSYINNKKTYARLLIKRKEAGEEKCLEHKKRVEPLILYKTYNEQDYPKYDNYDAIEVSRVKDIPVDYYGVMGTPITFLDHYCPEQFEIVGMAKRGAGDPALKTKVYTREDYENYSDLNAGPVLIKNKQLENTYPRILIKRRKQ